MIKFSIKSIAYVVYGALIGAILGACHAFNEAQKKG